MEIEIEGIIWKYIYKGEPNKFIVYEFIMIQRKLSKLSRSQRDYVEREFKRIFREKV